MFEGGRIRRRESRSRKGLRKKVSFFFVNIKSQTAKPTRFESIDHGARVDSCATAGVDEHDSLFHANDGRIDNRVVRRRGERRVQSSNDVTDVQ